MKYSQTVLLAMALTMGSSVVYAQGMNFTDIDTNKNGVVSEQEFNTAKSKRMAARSAEGKGKQGRGAGNGLTFAHIDTNHDNQLTALEMQQAQKGKRAGMRQGKGKDQGRRGMGQGKGMGRPPQPIFTDFDANNDNLVTETEYYEARNKRIAERAKEGRQMKGLANMASFADIDSNADGFINQDEFDHFLISHKDNHAHN